MIGFDLILQIFVIIGMFALVVWLFFWGKNMQIEFSMVQLAESSTRAWVGPIDSSVIYPSNNEKENSYFVELKNFGVIKAKNITASFVIQKQRPTRNQFQDSNRSKSSLGALFPNMDTKYSFTVDSELMQKTVNGQNSLYVGIYFYYEFRDNHSGFGLISRFNPVTKLFERSETWDN